MAQTAAAMLLERALEPVFHRDSYGYRPGRSAHDALAVCRRRCWTHEWVLVRALACASGWLEDRGLRAGGITPQVADDLEAGVPGTGPVLRFLRHAGIVDTGTGSEAGPAAALLAEFGAWLAGERGLSAVTVRGYRSESCRTAQGL